MNLTLSVHLNSAHFHPNPTATTVYTLTNAPSTLKATPARDTDRDCASLFHEKSSLHEYPNLSCPRTRTSSTDPSASVRVFGVLAKTPLTEISAPQTARRKPCARSLLRSGRIRCLFKVAADSASTASIPFDWKSSQPTLSPAAKQVAYVNRQFGSSLLYIEIGSEHRLY